jgi:hypothetical protein
LDRAVTSTEKGAAFFLPPHVPSSTVAFAAVSSSSARRKNVFRFSRPALLTKQLEVHLLNYNTCCYYFSFIESQSECLITEEGLVAADTVGKVFFQKK